MSADQRFVCSCAYFFSMGCSGSSRNGRFCSARSTSVTSKPECSRVRPSNHLPTARPPRPGRVLATTTWSLGLLMIHLWDTRGKLHDYLLERERESRGHSAVDDELGTRRV